MKTEELPAKTEAESKNTSSVKDQLLHNFKTSKDYRHAFVEEKVRTSIAAQIKAIREQRILRRPNQTHLFKYSPLQVNADGVVDEAKVRARLGGVFQQETIWAPSPDRLNDPFEAGIMRTSVCNSTGRCAWTWRASRSA